MAFKPTHARTADGERNAKKGKHSSYTTSQTSFSRPASRRVQAPAPVVDRREDATIAFIKVHADRKDKLLVSSERPHLRVRADAMRSLTVPLSQDGRRARQEHPPRPPAGSRGAGLARTAARYLQNDMVFFLVNHREHFFVTVLNFAKAEYQVLDSGNYARYNGVRFYEEAMSKIRDGVGRCMEEAGRAHVAGWRLRLEPGLPEQNDESSCGLFALKWMELWDGEELARSFSMDDVHAFRKKLAEELVFSELNEMQDVKEQIESKMT
ncbi:hypothetical protein TRIUR3_31073 [Triticum urartu]|uniref:Ubiquitin-like protease family profile domain-containing protein n=2 Tax=Triticum TaxID=4564 RepID=A0A9R0UTE6_TRITD|nr:hypothetical protein TRIUR3_31073 [Triticum urartu]VAH04247.1 unnamed protein product [Triticum turgidum subsp. durum]